MTFQINNFPLGELILSLAGLSGIAQVGKVGGEEQTQSQGQGGNAKGKALLLACVNIVMP